MYKYATNVQQKVQKNEKFFCCEICDYVTSRKVNWMTLVTLKHKNNENTTKNTTNTTLKKKHYCEYGKYMSIEQHLYNHKKNCSYGQELNPELLVQSSKFHQIN